MASSATNIHAPGFKFPGEMKDYCWEFPVVAVPKKDSDKLIYTKFYVGLLNSVVDKGLVSRYMNQTKGQKTNPDYNPNFNFSNFAIKLTPDILDHHQLGDKIAFHVVCTQQGTGKSLFRDITFVNTGKSLGTKKQTNVFTQAMSNVCSKFNKKMTVSSQKTQNIITPMLAHGEGISDRQLIIETIDNLVNSHLSTGLYVQPKYDGIRVLSTLNPTYAKSIGITNNVVLPYESNDNVICYSRNGKRIMITEHLNSELCDILARIAKKYNMTSLILDGEFYYHGMPLQEISGYARGTNNSGRKDSVNLMIYDYCDSSDSNYTIRYENLVGCKNLFDDILEISEMLAEDESEGLPLGHVLLSETKKYDNTADIVKYYDEMIDKGYEGIMIRLPEGIYESTRSKSLLKFKPFISHEYECIGYEFGVGKDSDIPTIKCKVGEEGVVNAANWLLRRNGTTSVVKNNKNLTFGAKFKGMVEAKQRQLGIEFQTIEANGKTKFENQYLGRMAIIVFLNFSSDGKPEKPNCIGFKFD